MICTLSWTFRPCSFIPSPWWQIPQSPIISVITVKASLPLTPMFSWAAVLNHKESKLKTIATRLKSRTLQAHQNPHIPTPRLFIGPQAPFLSHYALEYWPHLDLEIFWSKSQYLTKCHNLLWVRILSKKFLNLGTSQGEIWNHSDYNPPFTFSLPHFCTEKKLPFRFSTTGNNPAFVKQVLQTGFIALCTIHSNITIFAPYSPCTLYIVPFSNCWNVANTAPYDLPPK